MVNTTTLPQIEHKWLSKHRCVSNDIIDAMKICYTENDGGNPWIVLPIFDLHGETLGYKLRKASTSKAKQKYKNPKGSKAYLYGLPYLASTKRIVICEGEMDVLALLSLGIEAVCSTAGAGTFKKEWLEYFVDGMEVILCFDLDEAGQKGQQKVIKLFEKHKPNVALSIIKLPTDLPEHGDITDFILRCRDNDVKADVAIEQLTVPYKKVDDVQDEEQKFSVLPVGTPTEKIDFKQWNVVISRLFPDLALSAEACLSVVCQLLVTDVSNCFALVLVDAPSSGKTITINFFDGIEEITYSSDSFTPASFISNAANRKKEDLKDIDLLPRIRRKMLMVRDMATIFSARDDDLLKNMGILTRVLDGEGLSTDTGIHGRRALTGDYVFMLLAASTPIPLRVWKVMGTLGQRLFFVSMNTKTKSEDVLVSQLQDTSYKKKEAECKNVTTKLLQTIWSQHKDGIEWQKDKDDKNTLRIIARCALLLCRLRGQVIVYRDKWEGEEKDFGYTQPLIEKPDRVNQLLYNFCRGHAVAKERDYITEDDIAIVLRLTLDSAPGQRAPLFQELLRKNGELRTQEVETFLQCSNPTALREMKTLQILGLCKQVDKEFEVQSCIQLTDDLQWFLSDEFQQHFDTVS